jgi:hypothetical protein
MATIHVPGGLPDPPAGEPIAAGDPCFIDGAGAVRKAPGGRPVAGYAGHSAAPGEPVRLCTDPLQAAMYAWTRRAAEAPGPGRELPDGVPPGCDAFR